MLESGASSRYPSGERISVLLPLPLAGAYDYRVAEGMELAPGDFVEVPLGRRRALGVVWGTGSGSVAASKLKDVSKRLQAPPLPEVLRRFVDWVAAYTLSPPGAVLKMAMSVPAALSPCRLPTAFVLAAERPKIRMTSARRRILDVLAAGPPRATSELARQAATATGVIRSLAETGAIVAVDLPAAAPAAADWRRPGPVLSPTQADAAENLTGKTERGGFGVTLLDGVSGSGKTEVYFQAVAEALRRGRQVLVLLPEIALGAQWLGRFKDRFGAEPGQWHSDLPMSARRRTWRAVAEGRADVVVGARSALFLPFPDLGLIVIDEEHDASFKQEDGVVYNARDMAVVRARMSEIPLLLVSATPSLETVVNMKMGRYAGLHLPDRHAGAKLPEVSIIDMRADPPPRGNWLSPVLRQALEATFSRGEQAMLFLNRRGYAPLTLCRACGHRLHCPRCTAWLVEHRFRKSTRGSLQCHHCGFMIAIPERCPACEKEDSLVACGPGVERLAEEASTHFPGVRLTIATSDNIRGPRAAAELVRGIEEHDTDLLIGTQIVAKGYHFPLLTLVGVVDADLGLTGGDLRATERTYQLLHQVAGRAGRAARPGRVLLQTYMPDNKVMRALASGERDRFLEAEAADREQTGMPPFGRLTALIVSGPDERSVERAAGALGRAAPNAEGIAVLGPAPAPLALLRGRHRQRLLLKTRKDVTVQPLIRSWLNAVKLPPKVRVQVDVDPYSFL